MSFEISTFNVLKLLQKLNTDDVIMNFKYTTVTINVTLNHYHTCLINYNGDDAAFPQLLYLSS